MAVDVRAVLEATGLPLVPRLEEICAALADRRLAVLRADPGSGKSTLLPLALMESGEFGRILMLEPRRVAAASVAGRMADLLGESVGERIGYSVRMERRVGRNTRVEVVTEGLLVRRLLADPGLSGVSAVIFDEFHERSIHTDLALALCLDLRRLRDDLSILVMSATMDCERVSAFLETADREATGRTDSVPLIDCPGRPFPVAVDYAPLPGKRWLGEETAHAVLRLLSGPRSDLGDILVFLPGRREIEDAAGALRRSLADSGDKAVEVRVLYGSMPLSEQRDLLRPRGAAEAERVRRVVLATNIAETSLTVPGVRTVVDSGMVRTQRFHVPTGLDRLVLERASGHACDQRTGRAGRLAPGRCVRLWKPSDARAQETEPELLRSDAAPLVLDCALWGVRKASALFWLDPPTEASWSAAAELLRSLGALDDSGAPTARGELMSRLGVHPRLAAVALTGAKAGGGMAALALASAAALADRDGSGLRDDADFARRLEILRGAPRSGGEADLWRRRVADVACDLASRLGPSSGGAGIPDAKGCGVFRWTAEEEASVGVLLLAGFPDRVAKRQESGVFRFPAGREARVDGPLASAEWLVALEAEAGERSGTIRLASPVLKEDAEAALAASFPESRNEVCEVEWEGLVPRAWLVRRAGRLSLSERRSLPSAEAVAASLSALLESSGLSILPWGEGEGSPRGFLLRARFWARAVRMADLESSLEDEKLAANAPAWLGPFVHLGAKAGSPVLDASKLLDALRSLVGWDNAVRIDREAPERLETPAGTRRKLQYSADSVALEVRIQEVFGLDRTPLVAGVPVVLRLLSPAERPLQVTGDLAGFWRNTYSEVRKEMRGRYPRHYWPEDPLVAEPTSRPKKRGT